MRILIADDGSEFGRAAVDKAAEFIRGNAGAEVKVVTAIQPAAATDVEMLVESLEDLKDPSNPSYKDACDLCEASAARLSERLGESDVEVSREVLVGPAAQAIVELAEEWRPDLIVIGSHGRGFWKRMWLGSVADRVTRHAPCSVLIVRKPA